MLLLEDYCFSSKEINIYWYLIEKPIEIKAAISDAKRNTQVAEEKFLQKLETEKEEFVKELLVL